MRAPDEGRARGARCKRPRIRQEHNRPDSNSAPVRSKGVAALRSARTKGVAGAGGMPPAIAEQVLAALSALLAYASARHGDEVTASLTTGCTIGTLAAALNARSLPWLSDRGGSVAVVVARTEARGAARRLGADDRVELGAE